MPINIQVYLITDLKNWIENLDYGRSKLNGKLTNETDEIKNQQSLKIFLLISGLTLVA